MANLSQAEINDLLNNAAGVKDSGARPGKTDPEEDIHNYFSDEEIDALGEIGNICIGTSATTMSALVGRKVTITTPTVAVYSPENMLSSFERPFLAVGVEYIEGLRGKNLLIVRDYDAALITDLMMGGEGKIDKDNVELNDIHISAMSEIMNQMIGSAATAISDMVGESVNISPPQAFRAETGGDIGKYFGGKLPVIKISFDMEIENLLKSKLLQIMPIDVAKELIISLMYDLNEHEAQESAKTSAALVTPSDGAKSQTEFRQQVKVVRPASYQDFETADPGSGQNVNKSNFDLINDIPLQVTVELGKAVKNLSEILNLGAGSIVVLDKQAGDLVNVIVNGKHIARGEVVVVDENYGVRITEILKP